MATDLADKIEAGCYAGLDASARKEIVAALRSNIGDECWLPPRGDWEPWQEHLHEKVYAAAVLVTGDQPQASNIADAALRAALVPHTGGM